MTTATRTRTADPDLRRQAQALAEQQLEEDRRRALALLPMLAENITARRKCLTAHNLAEIVWLESRITMTETQNCTLWCAPCNDMAPMPAGHWWMLWLCIDHAQEQLARSAKSWERSLFAGVGPTQEGN